MDRTPEPAAHIVTPEPVAMFGASPLEPTLADAMIFIESDISLPLTKRRHWLCSVRVIATVIGRPPASLPARLTALRHHVGRLNAARMGIEVKTLGNHKSNLTAAINHFLKTHGVARRGVPLLPDWEALAHAIPDVKPRRLLGGLMRYCSARGLAPTAVDEGLVAAFFAFREETGFLDSGLARTRELGKAWNRCAAEVPGWPSRLLLLPGLPANSPGPDWVAFPEGLRSDVERHLASLARLHHSASGRRRKPCRQSTVITRRRELVAFARKAVAAGIAIDTLTSLETLLAPAAVSATFEAYLDGNGERPKGYTIDLAWKLHSLAREIKAPAETIALLDDIRARLEDDRGPAMTEKNLIVIRAVMMSDIWSTVIALPVQLMREAEGLLNRSPKKALATATVAIHILILSRAPVRIGNLMAIRLGYNLIRPGGDDKPFFLTFPNYDVKNRVDLDFPLSAATSELIQRYIDIFRPRLGGIHVGDWLFPGNGKKRSTSHASAAIAARVERETGLRATAHQFRHAAVAMILKENPGNYEFARRVLGHRNVATTTRFYAALEAFRAGEQFGHLIEDRLAANLEDKPRKVPRRRKAFDER